MALSGGVLRKSVQSSYSNIMVIAIWSRVGYVASLVWTQTFFIANVVSTKHCYQSSVLEAQ